MLRALSVTAPVVASVMIVVLLVEPPALRPAERLPTLRMLTVRAGESLDQKRVQAADPENTATQFNLGLMYATGEGVPQDYAEAVRWYRLAVEQGHAQAQYNLGVMYRTGRGVPQDDVQAHLWFNLAAARSTGEIREIAVNNRDLIAGRMTPDDLSEAQRLARAWDEAHPR